MSVNPSPPLIGADHVVLSKEELVKFDNVLARYTLDKAIHVRYTLGSFVHASPRDWIGLFAIEWQNAHHPLLFQRAPPRSKRKNKKPSLKRRVLFSANNIKEAVTCETRSYQFAYVTGSGDVVGVSKPFVFQLANDKSQYDAEVNGVIPTKRLDDSLHVNHSGSPADSEISIISPDPDLPNSVCSESPVLVSCCSDKDIDDEWESIQTLDPEETGVNSLSDDYSDIEILSTSPSKNNSLESPAVTVFEQGKEFDQPVKQPPAKQVGLLIQGSKPLGNTTKTKAQQALSSPSLESGSTVENFASITKKPVSEERTENRVPSFDHVAVTTNFPIPQGTHGNSVSVKAGTTENKFKNKRNFPQTGDQEFMEKDGENGTQMPSSRKKIIKEQFIEKKSQHSKQKQKQLCRKETLLTHTKGDRRIEKRKPDNKPVQNSKTIKEQEEDIEITKTPSPLSSCCETNTLAGLKNSFMVGNNDDKNDTFPEEKLFVPDSLTQRDLGLTLQSTCCKTSHYECSSTSSSTDQLQKCILISETRNQRNAAVLTGTTSAITRNRKKCQKKKKRRGRTTDDVGVDKDFCHDVVSDDSTLTAAIFESLVPDVPASRPEKENRSVYQKQQLKASLENCEDKDGVALQWESGSAYKKREMEFIRQKYIKKANTVINNKLRKTLKAKLKKQKRALIEKKKASLLVGQIQQDYVTTEEGRDSDHSKIDGEEKDERCNGNIDQLHDMTRESTSANEEQQAEPAGVSQEGKCSQSPSSSVISGKQSLDSLFKFWDPLLPCSQQTRPRVPGYLLDKMDALPVAKNDKSLCDWHRTKLPPKADVFKAQHSSKAFDQVATLRAPKASVDVTVSPTEVLGPKLNKSSDDPSAVSISVNESYANVLRATGSITNSGQSADRDVIIVTADDNRFSNKEGKDDHTVIGNTQGIDMANLSNYTTMDEHKNSKNSTSNLSKYFTESALDLQVSLLRNVEQKQRNRFKKNHLCTSRTSYFDLQKVRAKRYRKDMKLARGKKQAFKFAFPDALVNRDNETNKLQAEQEAIPCYDVTRFPFEKDVHTLTWPLPANVAFVSASSLDKTICRRREEDHPFLPMPGLTEPSGRNDNVDGKEKMQESLEEGVDTKPVSMALSKSLKENEELRQEALMMSRQLGRIEKELVLAKADCKQLKNNSRKVINGKSVIARRKDPTGLAKLQINSLKSQLKKNAKETVCLQNQVNALREQLKIENEAKIKNLTRGDVGKGNGQMEAERHPNYEDGSEHLERKKEWDVREPQSKKRKRVEDDDELEYTKPSHSEKAEPKDSLQEPVLPEKHMKTKGSRLYPDLEKEVASSYPAEISLEGSSDNSKIHESTEELRNILKASKMAPAPNSVAQSSAFEAREVIFRDQLSDMRIPDSTFCRPQTVSSMPVPVQADMPQTTSNSYPLKFETSDIHPISEQCPTSSFLFLHSPPASSSMSKQCSPDIDWCWHGTPALLTTPSTPHASTPGAHFYTEVPYDVQRTRHYQQDFDASTTMPPFQGKGLNRHKPPFKSSPKHAHLHTPWQPKKVKHTIGHQGCYPNTLGQAEMNPHQLHFKRPARPQSLGKVNEMDSEWFQNVPFQSGKHSDMHPAAYPTEETVRHQGEMRQSPRRQICAGSNYFQQQPTTMQNRPANSGRCNAPNFAFHPPVYQQQLGVQRPPEVNAREKCYPVLEVPTHPDQRQSHFNTPHVINPSRFVTPPGGVTRETVQEAWPFSHIDDNVLQWHLSPSACEMQTRPVVTGPGSLPPFTHYGPKERRSTLHRSDAYFPYISYTNPSYCNGNHVIAEKQIRQ